MSLYSAFKVTDNVHWVGAVDWNLRDFHGYSTHRGTTYNAFLVQAEKSILIDTVKPQFKDELLARISSVMDPKKIDYIISLHSEPDHTGSLEAMIAAIEPEKVFASSTGVETLKQHYQLEGITAVDNGEVIDLGSSKLTCLETRMLHWPESMMAYLDTGGVLFSQDGFGMHLASYERYADQLPNSILEYEAKKYYGNILLPYSNLANKAVTGLLQSGLDVKLIAPDHGPMYRENIGWILDKYLEWSAQKPHRKAVIAFDTMWQSTKIMARAISEGMFEKDVHVMVMSMEANQRSEVIYELVDAGALIVGSSTLNNQVLPRIADLLTYTKGLKPKNKIGQAFGSYGWSGESVKHIARHLEDMKMTSVTENIRVNYVPTDDDLIKCRQMGYDVADALIAKTEE